MDDKSEFFEIISTTSFASTSETTISIFAKGMDFKLVEPAREPCDSS